MKIHPSLDQVKMIYRAEWIWFVLNGRSFIKYFSAKPASNASNADYFECEYISKPEKASVR